MAEEKTFDIWEFWLSVKDQTDYVQIKLACEKLGEVEKKSGPSYGGEDKIRISPSYGPEMLLACKLYLDERARKIEAGLPL